LTDALADPDPGVRHATTVALGTVQPDPNAILPALIKVGSDADPLVRAWAVSKLGSALDDEAVGSTVLGATRDRDVSVGNRQSKSSAGIPSRRVSSRSARRSRRP
jgi:HEAT repeat protein